jgi:hypothetical protein
MERSIFPGVALILLGFFVGCSTVDSRIQKNPQLYAALSPNDQVLVHQGNIREGMPSAVVYLAWGRPDHVRYGNRQGVPFQAWIYTTTTSQYVPGYYPGFYGFGFYGYPGYRPYYGRRGFYGYPFYPYMDDVVSYEQPYKTAFFETDRCTGWEYIR